MKVSLNTVQNLVDFGLPPVSELVERVNAQLGGVEEIIDLGEKYKDALIVKVVECGKHPDADRLSVCQIDAGRGELVQVVCGAPNAHAGMWAVWLPPQSIVPSTFDDGEPFKLDERELRGVMSHGMLAAGDELAINSNHDGIVEITEADLAEGKVLTPGASFAEIFDLNDTIIDIENKMFTHRPDCFGQLGVAREISAIIKGLPGDDETGEDLRFVNPDWYWTKPEFANAKGRELTVYNDALEQVPRFMAVTLDNVVFGPSPLWLQTTLLRWGSKAINNVVDVTNYIMLLTAQPTHAYDYDKLRGHTIGARQARDGETITLLNGKQYKLIGDDIVIADGEGVIGLAGIMGGGNSEVSVGTKTVVLEVANFDMYTLRKSSMRHGLFTDALTRFNKGQSPLQTDHVMARSMQLLAEYSGAVQASAVEDLTDMSDQIDAASLSSEMRIGIDFINERLGSDLSTRQVGDLLRRVNFASYSPEDDEAALLVTVPFWRTDIEAPEDIVEEVGRLYGFDKLPRELPLRSAKPAPKNTRRDIKQKIRDSLSRSGANEVLTYSFVHENIMKKAEQDVDQAFKLSNALSPELQYYRLTVLPSLLGQVHMNIKAGHDEFTLFEIGKGHNKKYHADDDEGLPSELNFVDAVYASKRPGQGAAYFYMRRQLQQLALDLGFSVRFKPVDQTMDFPSTAPFDQARSALVEIFADDGVFVGMVGELKQSVIREFKLPHRVAAMTLDLGGLQAAYEKPRQSYAPLSKYPSITQDLSLKVARDVTYADVFSCVYAAVSRERDDIDVRITPVTIYQPADDTASQTITLRIRMTSHTGTLTDDDVSPLIDAAARDSAESIGATRA